MIYTYYWITHYFTILSSKYNTYFLKNKPLLVSVSSLLSSRSFGSFQLNRLLVLNYPISPKVTASSFSISSQPNLNSLNNHFSYHHNMSQNDGHNLYSSSFLDELDIDEFTLNIPIDQLPSIKTRNLTRTTINKDNNEETDYNKENIACSLPKIVNYIPNKQHNSKLSSDDLDFFSDFPTSDLDNIENELISLENEQVKSKQILQRVSTINNTGTTINTNTNTNTDTNTDTDTGINTNTNTKISTPVKNNDESIYKENEEPSPSLLNNNHINHDTLKHSSQSHTLSPRPTKRRVSLKDIKKNSYVNRSISNSQSFPSFPLYQPSQLTLTQLHKKHVLHHSIEVVHPDRRTFSTTIEKSRSSSATATATASSTVSSTRSNISRTTRSTIKVKSMSKLKDSMIEILDTTKPGSNQKTGTAICLSEEQIKILELIKKGKSVFFTGSAGTGKSVLLRSVIKSLKQKYGSDKVAITASTGLAACNIGGSTLHSFAGIGLGKESSDLLLRKVKRNKKAVKRWKKINALIVDEISMIDSKLFDSLDFISRRLTGKTSSPFGGIQLIVCGDFYQLPPINKEGLTKNFSFEADCWNTVLSHTIVLKQVFRQKGDDEFIDMLNEMRLGRISDKTCHLFQKLERPLNDQDGLIATELFPTRYEVDKSNERYLKNLNGELHNYHSIDTGIESDKDMRNKMLSNLLATDKLTLKLNAQVMMIKNIDDSLVNGSLGRVIDFVDGNTCLSENENESENENKNENDNPFNGITESPNVSAKFDRKKSRFLDLTSSRALEEKLYPKVRFLLPDGRTRDVIIKPEVWKIEDSDGNIIASRKQLPLILAWALSIHKSQGQTLTKVKVDLKKIFEKGQAYVALSRAVSRDGLQVLNFNKNKILIDSKVIDFYKKLEIEREKMMNGLFDES